MFNSIFTVAVGLYCADAIVKKVEKDTKKIVNARIDKQINKAVKRELSKFKKEGR